MERDPILINTKAVPTTEIDSHEVDILIVEDNQMVLKALTRFFRSNFKRVIGEQQTDQGLELITNELAPYSMVLSDFQNDFSYSGGQLALLSQPVRLAKHIPFIITSGSHCTLSSDVTQWVDGQTSIGQMIQDRLIDGIIPKPSGPAEYRQAILSCYKNQI